MKTEKVLLKNLFNIRSEWNLENNTGKAVTPIIYFLKADVKAVGKVVKVR